MIETPLTSLRFFLTAPSPCPYLPGRMERKVFTHLSIPEAVALNNQLSGAGFRRSQGIAYRPACEACAACTSARVPSYDYSFSASERRILKRNGDLERRVVPARATSEQFRLLVRYLTARHPEGGMADMVWQDFASMVEDSPVHTYLVEYRLKSGEPGEGQMVACVLVDALEDGLSLVYSFYDPDLANRGLGNFVILDQVATCQSVGVPYLYLGYWVSGSVKMAYKARFQPLEVLGHGGWRLMSTKERQPSHSADTDAHSLPTAQPTDTHLPRK
jgi:arginyl-tRNA--protein-N-Asp/Glu arginylyltransferase